MEALVGETIATDEQLNGETLQEHDRIHHPDGYHEGDTCKYRDNLKKETPEDNADELPTDNGSKQSGHVGSERGRLSEVADRVKGFIRGVTIKFSDKPYQEAEGDVRKSIKESEQKNWNKILDAFEHKTAGADATFHHQLLDHTPAVYQRLGVKNLPITIMGGVIHKMIGNIRNSEYDYHEIPVSELRNLLLDLDNPVAVFDSVSDPNALVVLTNVLDRHGNVKSVVPLKLDREASGSAKENVIASAYGQKPSNLQRWIDEGLLRYVNKKALRKSAQRLQLPRDSILKTHGVLQENDFSDEHLGEIIPDSPQVVKGGGGEDEDTGEVINFRDSQGKVVGTYNRATNEVVLYEGADADTIGHELCGHATWQFAEQQAKKGDDALLRKMNEVVDSPTAKPVWDEVRASYEGEDREVQREEVWAHIIGHETSKAIEEIQKSRSGRRWYQKFWNVVKDAWKGLLSTVRINSVHIEGAEEMSPKEFSEYIVKQMLERKTLGELEKGGEGGERKSIIGKKGAEKLGIGKLDEAQKMEKDGVDRKEIWQKTGWWRDKDNEWRIEITDIPKEVNELIQNKLDKPYERKVIQIEEDSENKRKEYVARENEIYEKIDDLEDEEFDKAIAELEKIGKQKGELREEKPRLLEKAGQELASQSILVEELLGDNKLLDAYPELRRVKVRLVPDGAINSGGYLSGNEIVLTSASGLLGFDGRMDDYQSKLTHEIQHFIQEEEGLSGGGAGRANKDNKDYWNALGEVEARNTEKRLRMTAEERNFTPPWETEDVVKEDQIALSRKQAKAKYQINRIEYLLKHYHPEVDAAKLLMHLSMFDTEEEMEAEIAKILGKR